MASMTSTEGRTASAASQGDDASTLSTILSLTTLMITRCSRDLRYLFATPAYAAMTGHTSEELIGKPIVEIMGKAGLDSIMPYVNQVLGGQTVHYEKVINFKNRGDRHLAVSYT